MIDSEGCAIFLILAKQGRVLALILKKQNGKKRRDGVRCGGNKSLG